MYNIIIVYMYNVMYGYDVSAYHINKEIVELYIFGPTERLDSSIAKMNVGGG